MEREYSIPDLETGYRTPVTKERYEAYMEMVEACRPKFDCKTCIPIIVGTGGDFEKGNGWKDFYNAP